MLEQNIAQIWNQRPNLHHIDNFYQECNFYVYFLWRSVVIAILAKTAAKIDKHWNKIKKQTKKVNTRKFYLNSETVYFKKEQTNYFS